VSGPDRHLRDVKAEIDDALHRAHALLRQTDRLLQEYRDTLERSHRLLEKSRGILDRAKRIIRLDLKVCIIQLVPLFSELIPYGPY